MSNSVRNIGSQATHGQQRHVDRTFSMRGKRVQAVHPQMVTASRAGQGSWEGLSISKPARIAMNHSGYNNPLNHKARNRRTSLLPQTVNISNPISELGTINKNNFDFTYSSMLSSRLGRYRG